jgi:tetratricopeptide (TPR) repeat protein
MTLGVLVARPALAATADELVRIAHAYEASHQEELAIRRYTEAISLDPTQEDAYMGLAALRAKRGDAREAERVLSMALEHVPSLKEALAARARVRRAVGDHEGAYADMEAFAAPRDDIASLRELAGWYGADGRLPAQLAVWRRILTTALKSGDAALTREARTMVRALQIMLSPVDPVVAPLDANDSRRSIAAVARRGG